MLLQARKKPPSFPSGFVPAGVRRAVGSMLDTVSQFLHSPINVVDSEVARAKTTGGLALAMAAAIGMKRY
jgi:hypothetical protein